MKATASAPALRFVLRETAPATYGAKTVLDTPEKIAAFYREVIATDESFEAGKENLVSIVVNTKLQLVGYNVVSVGTVNETNAHPREIMRPVIVAAGYGFILLHNHPSGDPSPSRADELVTRRIVEASTLMQLRFLDHVVMGEPSPGRSDYFSFREAGLIS